MRATPTPTTTALRISPPALLNGQRARQARAMRTAPISMPIRSPKRRRKGRIDRAPTPIIATGRVVSRLAVVESMPVVASIRSSSGPTAAIAGRRFSARAKMAAINNRPAPRDGGEAFD